MQGNVVAERSLIVESGTIGGLVDLQSSSQAKLSGGFVDRMRIGPNATAEIVGGSVANSVDVSGFLAVRHGTIPGKIATLANGLTVVHGGQILDSSGHMSRYKFTGICLLYTSDAADE